MPDAGAPAAETLEAVLTRNLAHVYGIDGYAAQVIARERLAAFDAMAAGHVPALPAILDRAVRVVRRLGITAAAFAGLALATELLPGRSRHPDIGTER